MVSWRRAHLASPRALIEPRLLVSSSVLPQPSATPSGKGATPTGTPAAPAAASWHEVGDAAHTPQKPQRPPAGGRGRLRPRPTASTLVGPPAAGEVLAGRRPRHVPSERTPNRTRPLEHDRKDGDGLRVAMLAPPWISVPPPGYGGVECVVSVLTQALVKRATRSRCSVRLGRHRVRAW